MTKSAQPVQWRDYSLTGADSGPGFTPKEWYSTPIPRKRMKELMRRSDKPGLINYGLWVSLVFASGIWVIMSWGSWWGAPALITYGIFYGSCADSRWHECSHGTVFKTQWLNNFFYQLSSFMALKNPYLWRWSHTRHHTDTVIVGRDPEIAFPRPPSIFKIILNLLHLQSGFSELKKMLMLSAGYLSDDQRDYLIGSERPKAFMASRIHLIIIMSVVTFSLILESWLPLILVPLPTFYGSWLHHLLASTQHAGLAEDMPDHRMNSRTVYMNPFFRFVYSNMNYHVEHHMFPMVPFYSLPALHDEIKADCPDAYPSTWAAFAEMIPAMQKQKTDPGFYIQRPLPEGANPSPDYQRPLPAAA